MKRLLVITCILFLSAAPLAVAQNLVGQWSFEGNLLDSSGNGNNGTVTGTVGYAPGRFGQALDFSAGGGTVTIPNSPSLQTPNFTVAYWAYLNFDNGPDIATKSRSSELSSAWQVSIVPGRRLQGCLFGGGSDCWYSSPGSISPDPVVNWTHVAVTYDGATINGYANGILVFTAPASYLPGNGTADILLGNSPDGGFQFYGLIDELQIYDGALSATQVHDLANPVPTDKNQCKNGGWQFLSRPNGTVFKNQGDCIQYVNTGKQPLSDGANNGSNLT